MEQLQQLNPYVRINSSSLDLKDLNDNKVKDFILKYQCIVLTEIKDINLAIRINEFSRQNEIKFLLADVYGLFGWSFSDFGTNFEVLDVDGEEYREQFIGNIKIDNDKLIIETLDKKLHDLESNDLVELNEILGMLQLNGNKYQIQVINPHIFSIQKPDNLDGLAYKTSGCFKKVKIMKKIQFKSLNDQLKKPDLLLSELSEVKFFNPYLVHLALNALYIYNEHKTNKFSDYLDLVKKLKIEFEQENNLQLADIDQMAKVVYYTQNSSFPPLCAFFGGLVGQEILKSITNKFMPVVQFINLDFIELFEIENNLPIDQMESIYSSLTKNDRFDNLRQCFGGETTVDCLKKSKLFMVGCGAIGCEMLKNYALLGLGSGDTGFISITDNDIIEKSNLNRQFLFRQSDIQKSKSLAATAAVLKMNPEINIKTYEKKVSIQTENELFNDKFFQNHDVCVNALDNVEARRYMDNRCVSNQKPLLESGTLGPKGTLFEFE